MEMRRRSRQLLIVWAEERGDGASEIGGAPSGKDRVCGGGMLLGWSGISIGAACCRRDLQGRVHVSFLCLT